MILAAGLSPAWQQIALFDTFRPGEVNRAREVHWCASGKVLNVGIALGHLKARSKTLSLVGGSAGSLIQQEFRDAGYDARWIESRTPTRVCTTILDAGTSTTTELVENSAPVTADDLSEFLDAYAAESAQVEWVVLSGSLPDGTQSTFYRDLLKATPGKAVLDVRGPELLAALECKPFLVKPNREELGRTFSTHLNSDELLIDSMHRLNELGAEWVVITQGRKPVFVTSKNFTARLEPPEGQVVNPIGCGDSMAAGIAWGLSLGCDPPEAIRLGMAAANDNLSQLLPARLNADRVCRIAVSISIAPV